MTEDQIEHIAEREMDRLDKQLLNGSLTQDEYLQEVKALDAWVREEYKGMDK